MASKGEKKSGKRKADTEKDVVDSDDDDKSPPTDGGSDWIWFFQLGAKRLMKCQNLHQNTRKDYNLLVSTLPPDQEIDTGIAASIRCILLREYGDKKDLFNGQGLSEKRKAYLSVIEDEMKIYDAALLKAKARGKGKGKGKTPKKGLRGLRKAFEKLYE